MIKKLVMLFLAVAGFSLAAVPAPTPSIDASRNSFYSVTYGSQYGYSLTTKKDAALSIQRTWTDGYDAFGYFTYDNKGQIVSKDAIKFNKSGYADLGNFDQGTNVGFWLNNDGTTYYSVNKMNGWNNYYVDNAYDKKNGTFESVTNNGWWYTGGIDFKVNAAKPVGQPLPGVLLSAIIGLASLTGWKLRAKKS